MRLRPYQKKFISDIEAAWAGGYRNVLATMPTGSGKTEVFCHIANTRNEPVILIAHRSEILGHISLGLARRKVLHNIIGPDSTARGYARQHRAELGRSWLDPNANMFVASVDTLTARFDTLKSMGKYIKWCVIDEAHHVLESNKWGRASTLFPSARILGVTATPMRADKKSLQLGRGGLFQKLIIGPTSADLTRLGYLCPYIIWAPPSLMDMTGKRVGASGDYSANALLATADTCRGLIVGNVVDHYLKLTPGKLGLTFVSDVKTAEQVANHFNIKGVPAAALSAKTPQRERFDTIANFRNKKILQLINVGLFGEGFDLPGVEVVSDASPTMSYPKYLQRWGRLLRPAPNKPYGVMIDHVGNIFEHLLPDKRNEWSLEQGRSTMGDNKLLPLRKCLSCFKLWEGYARECPRCGYVAPVSPRAGPVEVDGDLKLLSLDKLRKLSKGKTRIDTPASKVIEPLKRAGAPPAAIGGLQARHIEKQTAQRALRHTMAIWGARRLAEGLSDSARHVKFYREFGVDVLTAQGLKRIDAEILNKRIQDEN